MDPKEILELVKAGYTKQEIEVMYPSVPNDTPENPDGTGSLPVPDDSPDPPEAEASEKIALDTAKWLKEITGKVDQELERIKKAYEEYSILASNNKEEVSKGAIDVFGEIINPPNIFNKEKE